MDTGTILRALSQGGNCSRIGPGCGGGLAEYATMAAAGQIPSRFEIGCLVPMQFDVTIGAGGSATVEQEPRQDVLPVALFAALSGADVIIDQIIGPDGDPAGLKGNGIGPSWRPAFFSYEALRSCVNPFPRDVGVVTSSKSIAYEVTNSGGVAEDFVGITFGFIAGTDGIAYMQKCNMIDSSEAHWLKKIQAWCDSGQAPGELLDLGCRIIGGNGNGGGGDNGGQRVQINGRIFAPTDSGTYVPVP